MNYEPSLERDPVVWVEYHLPAAIEFANREREATEAARARNLKLMRERGVCWLGHEIFVEGPPKVPCGYCENVRAS